MTKGSTPHLISVIIPVYNGERYIREALDSVFIQPYRPLQVIVVDDGSSDKTAFIVKSFNNVEYIYQENRGQALALNRGLLSAQGDYLTFIDADDYWPPEGLSVLAAYLDTHPGVDCVMGTMRSFIDPHAQLPKEILQDRVLLNKPGQSITTLLARRTVFEKVGSFDSSYPHNKGVDWICRAKEHGFKIESIPDVVLHRRLHDLNMSYSGEDKKAELLRIAKELIEKKRRSCLKT